MDIALHETDLIEFEPNGHVVDIRLNRPDRLNAFSDDLARALIAGLREFDYQDELRVAVLSGNGRAFSSGADVIQRQSRTRDEFVRLGGPEGYGAKAAEIFTRSVNWKPVIAAVHSYAIGMGLGVALSADLCIMEEGTQLQITETGRGLSPVRYMTLLRSRGNPSFATEMALTGRWFSAEEAFEAGVIDRLVPKGKALEVAHELAAMIAANPPLPVRAAVRNRRLLIDAGEREAAAQTDILKLHLSEDFTESAAAFREKRPPRPFNGR
jgi:enoyl-CoA hydratase/carnithine racemase